MPFYFYPLQFLSGALLMNAIPHTVAGVSGAPFQSPFASPPGEGESSPRVNVAWGFGNLVGGLVLLNKLAPVDWIGWTIVGAGAFALGWFCAGHFAKVRAKRNAVGA